MVFVSDNEFAAIIERIRKIREYKNNENKDPLNFSDLAKANTCYMDYLRFCSQAMEDGVIDAIELQTILEKRAVFQNNEAVFFNKVKTAAK
jgi:hypothetical protein